VHPLSASNITNPAKKNKRPESAQEDFQGAFFCPRRAKKPGFPGLRYRYGPAFGVAASHPSNPSRGPRAFRASLTHRIFTAKSKKEVKTRLCTETYPALFRQALKSARHLFRLRIIKYYAIM
jgi:hypothetical protein